MPRLHHTIFCTIGIFLLIVSPFHCLPDGEIMPCIHAVSTRRKGQRDGPLLPLRGGMAIPDTPGPKHGDEAHGKQPRVVRSIRRALGLRDFDGKKPLKPAPVPQARPTGSFNALAAVCVLAYISSSLGMTLINKYIFSVFSYPLTVTGFQLVVSLLLVWMLGLAGKHSEWLSFAPPPEFDPKIARAMLPVTTLFIAMLSTTNYCLKTVDITFYQVLRSLVIPINLMYAYLRFGDVPKPSVIVSCLTVVVGFVLGTSTELNFTAHGFVAGIISSFFVAMYSIAVKQALPAVSGSTWRLMQYTTLLSIFMLLPVIVLSGEAASVMSSQQLSQPIFWSYMSVASVIGFLINVFFFLLIKFASPLSTHISGCFKSALQTVLSVLIFGNRVTPGNWVGICLTLAGSTLYSLDSFLFPKSRGS